MPFVEIECSDQPLDISFHPSRPTIVVAALVDGTVEVHDFTELLEHAEKNKHKLKHAYKKVIEVEESDDEDEEGKNADGDEDLKDDDSDVVLNDGKNGGKDADGDVEVKDEEEEDEIDSILSSTAVHTQQLPCLMSPNDTKPASASCCTFSYNGTLFFSGGTAGDIVCLDASRICSFQTSNDVADSMMWSIPNASFQKSPLYVVQQISQQHHPNLLVSGDEQGSIRIFDLRLCGANSNHNANHPLLPRGCIHAWREHSDHITSVTSSPDGNQLLATSADCRLSVYDLRNKNASETLTDKQRFLRISDDQEYELLNLQIMKFGRKVVCGTGEGVLALYNYGVWGDMGARFPLVKGRGCVESLVKIDEHTLLVGASDGLIRVVSIQPDVVLGLLGDGEGHDGLPVEKLRFNCNREFVGSVTHDNIVRLWDAKALRDDVGDVERVDDSDGAKNRAAFAQRLAQTPAATTNNNNKSKKNKSETKDSDNSDAEWEDMEDEEMEEVESATDSAEEDDSDSDDSEDDNNGGGRRGGRGNAKNDERSKRLNKNMDFFADL